MIRVPHPHRPLRLLVLTSVALVAGGALADGVFYAGVDLFTEHRGSGAPEHWRVVVNTPVSNWSQVEIVDIDEEVAWACVRYIVTGLDLAYNCEDGSPVCWPIDESYDTGKVTVVVSHGDTGKTLVKLVAKYEDGDTGGVCKEFPARNLLNASTVVFTPKAKGLAAKELKLFAYAAVGLDEGEGARLQRTSTGLPGPARATR